MVRRLLNLAVLVAILVGGVLAWRSGEERARREERYRGLVRAAGELDVVDPTKVYVLAIDTGEPLHFAWRVHTPANYLERFAFETGGGSGSSSSTLSDPAESIIRIRFRRDEAGSLLVFHKQYRGSGVSTLDPELSKFLEGREQELIFERLAADGPVEMDPLAPATVLRVAMPPAMIAEARAALPARFVDRHVPDLARFRMGPPAPPQP